MGAGGESHHGGEGSSAQQPTVTGTQLQPVLAQEFFKDLNRERQKNYPSVDRGNTLFLTQVSAACESLSCLCGTQEAIHYRRSKRIFQSTSQAANNRFGSTEL